MKCVDAATAETWKGDAWCDDGKYGMNLVGPAFNYDGGACY